MDFESFLNIHKSQLESSQIPAVFWCTIFEKLTKEIFSTGEYFSIEKTEYEDTENNSPEFVCNGNSHNDSTWQSSEIFYENCHYQVVVECDRMEPDCGENVFLIDHMWTFDLSKRKQELSSNENLMQRLCALMEINMNLNLTLEQKIDLVEYNLFKYCQSYALNDVHNSLCTYWYIMDEFGSKITHSLQPSFRCVPFIYLPDGVAYNLLFPLVSLVKGDLVTRNYVESLANPIMSDKMIAALLIPWQYSDLSGESFEQFEKESSFVFKHTPEQIMPLQSTPVIIPSERPLKVYSQYKFVNENLTDPNYQLCENREEADILWLSERFVQYKQLSREKPNTFVNQFPFENILNVKDLFAIVSRRARTAQTNSSLDDFSPSWLMPTYDLQNELVQFVSLYQNRTKQSLDNHWIVKPWNLSRGMDTVVTSNLSEIVKLRNALPKVVSKYIERPVLFKRDDIDDNKLNVKFDLRFIVLLKSIRPLTLYVYKKFWIRFANNEFSLDEFDNYQKHFTVMNYVDGANTCLKQMDCSEFVVQFDSQYGKNRWSALKADIYAAMKETFECAIKSDPPAGLGHCVQSRALYGIDVLPRWQHNNTTNQSVMRPTVLEVNWMPDCKRACEYYPTFYNDIFNALFRDKLSNDIELL